MTKPVRSMRKIMKTFFLFGLILVACVAGCHAQEKLDRDVARWTAVQPPPRSDWQKYYDFLNLANHSEHEWIVRQENGKVVASLKDDNKPSASDAPAFDTTVQLQASKGPANMFLKVDDGWIAAYNRGEFGAAVYWFNSDGKKRQKLSDHQINQFMVDNGRIFAVEGLAHMVSRGSMIELRKEKGQWTVEEFFPLSGSAEAIAQVSSGDYVIVTSDMLLRVNLEKEINILIPNGDWGALYPNSVAIADDGYIYIGMRQFVVKCKLSKSVQSFTFLVPNKAWLNTKIE